MKLYMFIEAIKKCGWKDTGDAQHENIEKLHRVLFPVIAELEDENATLIQNLEAVRSL